MRSRRVPPRRSSPRAHRCRHLYGTDRMLITWKAPTHATVLTVEPHDRTASDIYDLLLAALALEVPSAERASAGALVWRLLICPEDVLQL